MAFDVAALCICAAWLLQHLRSFKAHTFVYNQYLEKPREIPRVGVLSQRFWRVPLTRLLIRFVLGLALGCFGYLLFFFSDGYTVLGDEEVMSKFGVKPSSLPDLFSLVGDVADNIPGEALLLRFCRPRWVCSSMGYFFCTIMPIYPCPFAARAYCLFFCSSMPCWVCGFHPRCSSLTGCFGIGTERRASASPTLFSIFEVWHIRLVDSSYGRPPRRFRLTDLRPTLLICVMASRYGL